MAVGRDVPCLKRPLEFLCATGQYSDINFSYISKHELRPFTIASDRQELDSSFYVYVIGDRAQKSYHALTG